MKYILLIFACAIVSMVHASAEDQGWSLTNGVLTVTKDFVYSDVKDYPWVSEKNSITAVVFTDDVTAIGAEVCYNYLSLESVSIGNAVKSIGKNAFSWCQNLKTVNMGNGVESIAEAAFKASNHITELSIPSSVISIDTYAFDQCSGLTDITIPSGVKSIGQGAFSNCVGLTNLTISEGVETIGKSAFSTCESLTKVIIPQSVGTIDNYAFEYCEGLTDVTIPEGVEVIGNSAFFCCTNLTSVVIPNSVTKLDEEAFASCTKLETVTIGSGVTEMDDWYSPFAYSPVKTIYSKSTTPSKFGGFDGCTIYIPTGTTSVYQSKWGSKNTYIETTYTLTLDVNDLAMGTVIVEGEGIVDNQDGTYTVAEGIEVTIVAQPAEGYHLASWSNDAALNEDDSQTITITSDTTITAVFAADVVTPVANVDAENVETEVWFDLSGRRLQSKPATPGLYIRNGKKALVK
ncbi:MAG: leucine-rich repeat domain-containing protein [Marinilabiliaceae bacterium]|nr:leucine-rich repeat domain-containing protein [Marinilabiliaceae bacterium]